jgi:hypothetical protein
MVNLAKDRNKWWALLDTLTNLQILQNVGISLPAVDLLSAQEGLLSIELFSEGNDKTVPMHAMNAYGGVKVEFHSFLTLRPGD